MGIFSFSGGEVEKETVSSPSEGFPTKLQSKDGIVDIWGFSVLRVGITQAWAPSGSKTQNSRGMSEFQGNIRIPGGYQNSREI